LLAVNRPPSETPPPVTATSTPEPTAAKPKPAAATRAVRFISEWVYYSVPLITTRGLVEIEVGGG
jgi:hypothetical protein